MDLQIAGRVAMVAASSRGIGKAIAMALAREGCRVSICGRNPEALHSAWRELAQVAPDGQFLASPCDVMDTDSLAAWHGATAAQWGPVDILVTSTGGPPAGRFLELSEEQWRNGIESTLFNILRLSRLVLPQMRERRWGRIVHITSFVAKQPMPLLTVSSTLRAGLSALTRTMAIEFARDGILVNAVLPGYVSTDRQAQLNTIRAREEGIPVEQYAARAEAAIPLGRSARPSEIADVVAFLCGQRSSYLTGATIQVDGGLIGSTF